MASVLCVWEMGSNLGHLANLKSFVDSALSHNHQVTLVAKELFNLDTLFPGYPIRVFQAPYHFRRPLKTVRPLLSYSQLIQQRFESNSELDALVSAWRSIFAAVSPDVVVYDNAPTALIASMHQPWQKWVAGSGFLIPRCDLPYFGLFPRVENTDENKRALDVSEAQLLAKINSVLARRRLPTIESPAYLMTQKDQQLLLTIPELDHFGARRDAQYLGIPLSRKGVKPQWPANGRFRAFGYLSYFQGITTLFEQLIARGVSLNIYSRSMPKKIRARFPQIVFSDKPADLEAVAKEADFVINNCNHSTVAQVLLCGKPQLVIPLHQEQFFLSMRIAAEKRGVLFPAGGENPEKAISKVLKMAEQGLLPVDPEYKDRMTGKLLHEHLDRLFSGI